MLKDRYFRNKAKLLKDKSIIEANRKTISDFLDFEEIKLKRRQGLSEVDEKSYKTLNYYLGRFRNLNNWLNNKDWSKLTEKDIKKLIDDLEDGNIKTKNGDRFSDRSLYYNMIQGKLFSIIKKAHIARQILEDFSIKGRENNNAVRFIPEEDFRKIDSCVLNPEHKCLLWLAWDIGENVGTLIQLDKDDFKRQINPDTNEPEYLVILEKVKLKRSRTPRSELTNFKETVEYLDITLKNIKPASRKITNKYMKDKKDLSDYHPDDQLFKFGWKAAENFLKAAAIKSGVRCMPGGERPTWKDLRSSMACDLLVKGWSSDEVNSRLGHKPSSRQIDKYINYLALDRKKPKKKFYESSLKQIQMDFEKQKEISKLQGLRIENLKSDMATLAKDNKKALESIGELIKIVKKRN